MSEQIKQDLDLIHKHCAASLCPEHFEAWERIAAALNAQAGVDTPQDKPDAPDVYTRLRQLEAKQAGVVEALEELCDTLGECGMTAKARAVVAAVKGVNRG